MLKVCLERCRSLNPAHLSSHTGRNNKIRVHPTPVLLMRQTCVHAFNSPTPTPNTGARRLYIHNSLTIVRRFIQQRRRVLCFEVEEGHFAYAEGTSVCPGGTRYSKINAIETNDHVLYLLSCAAGDGPIRGTFYFITFFKFHKSPFTCCVRGANEVFVPAVVLFLSIARKGKGGAWIDVHENQSKLSVAVSCRQQN